jgi:hypothetical protein
MHKPIIVLLFLLLGAAVLQAQPKSYSPASRIGLGQLKSYDLAVQHSMGGLSTAFQDNIYTNVSNPAALGWLRAASLDIGIFAEQNEINANDGNFSYWTGNISHLNLSFPIFNPINDLLNREERNYGWGMMLGLMPFSETGYDIVTDVQDEDLGLIRRQYTGTGGAYSLMWGNGFRYKNFGIGVRAEYIFGDLREDRFIRFLEVDNSFQNIYRDDQTLGALRWEFGSQYKWVLQRARKSDGSKGGATKSLTFGATLASNAKLNVTESSFYRSQHNVFGSVIDTILLSEDVESSGVLPGGFSLGIMFRANSKWMVGSDIDFGFWEKYENEARPADLNNTYGISTGFGYTPDENNIDNYLKRMTYRAGVNYGTDPRVIGGEQMEAYSLNVGLTLPFIGIRRTAYGNLSFSYGERYVTNGISETFYTIRFGFTAADNQWFVKSKFN